MEVTLKDGRKLNGQTMSTKGGEAIHCHGWKALDPMAPVLGKKCAQDLMSTLFNIEKVKDVRALRRLYAR